MELGSTLLGSVGKFVIKETEAEVKEKKNQLVWIGTCVKTVVKCLLEGTGIELEEI